MTTRKIISKIGLTGIMGGMGAMNPIRPIKPIMPILPIFFMVLMLLFPLGLFAQEDRITIGGNVYGGGNHGKVGGNATVTVRAGSINKVFAGARMADVGGRSFLNVDGENASTDIFIVEAYGGNDIAGTIGTSEEATTVPEELTDILEGGETKADYPRKNEIDNTWKTFVRTSRSSKTVAGNAVEDKAIIIGSIFGGGNGEYYYVNDGDTHEIYASKQDYKDGKVPIASNNTGFSVPELPKTYLEIKGGCIAHLYGGGNNATVTQNTTIFVDNQSDDLETLAFSYAASTGMTVVDVLNSLKSLMNLPTFQNDYSSWKYNFGRIFGGNNKADMAIRPTWNLQTGKIRDLYSGGNRGRMTNKNGILLDINPVPDGDGKTDRLRINNVYGGCRMADVRPKTDEWDSELYNPVTEKYGDYKDAAVVDKEAGYYFPPNFAAHTLVQGGDINNVYGGNDIMGRVYFGNAVGVATSIRGDVYGGGNGAYAYTDYGPYKDDPEYSDFYYSEVEQSPEEALLDVRPNAEQVSLMIRGTEDRPTIIGGSVYCGGNCATLKQDPQHAGLPDYPITELKLGSYAYADNVYLGNNGAGMEDKELLKLYQRTEDGYPFNSMQLTDPDVMKTYMRGVAMDQIPLIRTENKALGDRNPYIDYTTFIGSLYLGGNVGSMTYAGKNTMDFDAKITVYDKVVGGCNKANVPEQFDEEDHKLNARYEGGILGATTELAPDGAYKEGRDNDGDILDRLEMNFKGLRIEPKRWKVKRDDITYEPILTDGKPTYQDKAGHDLASLLATCPDCSGSGEGHACLEWHTVELTNTYPAVADGSTLVKGKEYFTSDDGTGEFTATGLEVADGTNFYELKRVYKEIANGTGTGIASEVDKNRRLLGGDVYGGCYTSGHVNGNVVINMEDDLHERHKIFDVFEGEEEGEDILYARDSYLIKTRNSGVILNEQGMDVLGDALNVFGGGYGAETEIWGSTTINQKRGYTFQIFGGGELGVIGRGRWNGTKYTDYAYDPKYSTTINLHGTRTGDSRSKDKESPVPMADCEFIYGGGFEGLIAGDTHINLGNGRVFNTFAGCCNADVLGHTETYIGRGVNYSTGEEEPGFPWVRDYTYGGNDLGGTIRGNSVFNIVDSETSQGFIRTNTLLGKIHKAAEEATPSVLNANAYTEYRQGRAVGIYGGCFGDYDYSKEFKYVTMPFLTNAFVNFRPTNSPLKTNGSVARVLGAGEGFPMNRDGDKTQDRSYVLIDIPSDMKNFQTMEVFGSGNNNGLGMRTKIAYDATETVKDAASAIIDLWSGQIGNAFGGSYNEGNTYRTVVNVPKESTIVMYSTEPDEDEEADGTKTKHEKRYGNIFGGAYGTQILPPCDVMQSVVNYASSNATVNGAIFGGNNNERRTLRTQVNISVPVYSNREKGYLGTVYGAGQGQNTWSEYTEVNLTNGAKVYEVYGGGMMGHVLNTESVQKYMELYKDEASEQIKRDDPNWNERYKRWKEDAWTDAWTFGEYFTPTNFTSDYLATEDMNMTHVSERPELVDNNWVISQLDGKTKFNTNVIINEGATVGNYAYGGGYGKKKKAPSGDVYGTTYIALLGGKVTKDIYAAGTAGAIYDLFAAKDFTASANAYIKGGTCRNVYGGGWEGNVGYHAGEISASPVDDIPGETHVVIGDQNSSSFTNGCPAIQRNVYGGGEGGAVYGTAHLTLNDGYVGYVYLNDDEKQDEVTGQIVSSPGAVARYDAKIIDETYKSKTTYEFIPNTNLMDAGCLFGGGYIDNSSVDKTRVNIYGGTVRTCAFGGGEIAAIGRGDMKEKAGGKDYELKSIYRPGKTNIEMYGGHVRRDVYGGGRGYDNLGRHGTLNCDGFVFGQTEVHIHGGEIGTTAGVADGDGNVFGGCDIGHVYSAYEITPTTFGKGVKSGERYDGLYEGYYYQHDWADDGAFVTKNIYFTQAEIDAAKEGDPAYEKTTSDVKETERQFTEDCKVLIEPHCKVLSGKSVTFGTGDDAKTFNAGEYVPIDYLNTLNNKNSSSDWNDLDPTGIIIHNAVFAGGNSPSGALTTSASTNSVFGNATASIHDVFHRDLITLGTRHTGGLYGDGNLTLVDGYRELNITNYGTDYYSIAKEISITTYRAMPSREAAYYELNYTCMKECQDKLGTTYNPKDPNNSNSKAATITADEMLDLFLVYNETTKTYSPFVYGGKAVLQWNPTREEWEPNPDAGYWEESGVLPVYAGRLMNSIQRADFCGVFGSRMVMQGAEDRVPEEADYTNYTINRVREVSLNKMDSKIATDLAISEGDEEYYKRHRHGNYFGIYNVVNFLGSLTSDVDFHNAIRKTDNTDEATYKCAANEKAYGEASFYDWKKQFIRDKRRNNGNSHNKVALASGVYLEITTEESTGSDLYEKVWGPITGVVELDLINVAPGIGGGFVYAKNIHGIPSKTGHENTTLTALNNDAVTKWDYEYNTTDTEEYQKEWETSGNFVHSTQTIIDDCYNISNRYVGKDKMPAHFWYIKGSTYVYDQYISAYTGTPNAYSESVEIPLTIAAASHGKMKLLNVMPNRYAYYARPGEPLGDGKKMIINGKTYYKNDPISYWDWYLLSNYEKELFVEKTYVNCITCKIDGVEYAAGSYVMTESEFTDYKNEVGGHTYKDADNMTIKDADDNPVGDNYIFRESNNVSHDKGYLLTYEVTNPSMWDTWYTLKNGDYQDKKTLTEYSALDVASKALYEDGPTYRLKAATGGAVLGQREYSNGDLIPEAIYTTYESIKSHVTEAANGKQATFEKAYIVKNRITIEGTTSDTYYNTGTAVPASFASAHSSDCEEAYICTKSIQLTKEDVIYKDSKMKKSDAEAYISGVKDKMGADYKDKTIDQIKALTVSGDLTEEKKKELITQATLRDELETYLVQAYYCTSVPAFDSSGDPVHYYYGGNYYESGHNYRGLEAWSSMSETDREQFTFNYDALDLLIDPDYTTAANGAMSEGHKYQYDSANKDLAGANANKAHYSLETAIDYTAEYNGESASPTLTNSVTVKHSNGKIASGVTSLTKGDELSREEFEDKLVNEQRYYSTIAVKDAGTYYVVNTPFQIGSTPYAVGETISSSTYSSLPPSEQSCVTSITFTENNTNFYYCREPYTITTGNKVKSIKGENSNEYGNGATVPVGAIISADNIEGGYTGYSNLTNEQRNFTIHGVSPTETSTFFVSRESDIYDLSKEKIITVIYKYDYDETDVSGNVTPISERHVLNIHLTFKSGVPIVEDITPPEIILPGDYVVLREPDVTPGAYEITGGGWEIFATQREAESHTNGIDYNPVFDPLYWYQDGYYVAYYAKSYLGRTYSNAVPVKVANYHDMKKVMDDKDNHYFIDHKNVKRDSKIYINDYSASDQNGLDLFKSLFDLSLLTSVAESGDLKGHALLNERVTGSNNLEFFLRTDIDHSEPWDPIGTDTQCFEGTLHGDGHCLTGLDHSLFKHLCGDVYNLGVMGSFTTAGIVDEGNGYVESCWTNTTGTPADPDVYAVFGNPSRTSEEIAKEGAVQIVNSYYQEGKAYKTSDSGDRGIATPKPDKAFYNGEVTYDLNSFYLNKRYYHGIGQDSGKEYRYLPANADGTLPGEYEFSTGYYPTSGYAPYSDLGYVEERFADGDFIYAAGVIPDDADIRLRKEEKTNSKTGEKYDSIFYAPIWPDDYLFFGQALNYGYLDGQEGRILREHQEWPSVINRSSGRVDLSENGNRVYRAPAYFRNSTMDVAHFNPNAFLAQTKKDDASIKAYPYMTAIDFAGLNGDLSGGYKQGLQGGRFYAPLLDDDGLTAITNCDETHNLLVYAPAESSVGGYFNKKTYDVLTDYFFDPEFNIHYDRSAACTQYADGKTYDRVALASTDRIFGHLVHHDLEAKNDHLLVDRHDFDCPISYAFASDKRMWYQRIPFDGEYVDSDKGWQGISLPFIAELTSTHQKGEITHFYSGSEDSKNGTGTKIGHEYWLRGLEENGALKLDAGDPADAEDDVLEAIFDHPAAGGSDKVVENTFLWDYYYEGAHGHKDKNLDEYQTYYKHPRNHRGYAFLNRGTPYILGLPSTTYYEFDLSGEFFSNRLAITTATPYPEQLEKQVITFASAEGADIRVSDLEKEGVKQTYSSKDYYFKPNYLNIPLTTDDYVLNAEGDHYEKLTSAATAEPFRPFFRYSGGGGVKEFRRIKFSKETAHMIGQEDNDDMDGNGELRIRARYGKIIVTSTLAEAKDVVIVTSAGALIDRYTIQPGQTIETPVNASGVYIVNKKKVAVKIK